MRSPMQQLSPVVHGEAENPEKGEMPVGSSKKRLPGIRGAFGRYFRRKGKKGRPGDHVVHWWMFGMATCRMVRLPAFILACLFTGAGLNRAAPSLPAMPERQRPKVAEYLPAIAWVESRSNQWAVSYRGASYGRGNHNVSEICFEHWKWLHWDHWVVKQKLDPTCLFNAEINEEVALWYLKWLENYYRNKWNPEPWILSAYCYGPTYTDQHGPQLDYVTLVKIAMKR